MSQIASMNTTACRKHLFHRLITSLALSGFKDPLIATLREVITLSSDSKRRMDMSSLKVLQNIFIQNKVGKTFVTCMLSFFGSGVMSTPKV